MADSFTPVWGLTKPEIGFSRDTWGAKVNHDLDVIDAILAALMPIGGMVDFAGNSAPAGWLFCDGAIYSVATYPKLAAVLGGTYGGDGTSTFGVPDLRGRSTAGVGSTTGDFGTTVGITLGQKIGDSYFHITQAHLPSGIGVTSSTAGNHVHPGSGTDAAGDHGHTAGASPDGSHTHPFTVAAGVGLQAGAAGGWAGPDFGTETTSASGLHDHVITVLAAGLHTHGVSIAAAGDHAHSFSLGGSDTPLRVIQPIIGATKIIFCGPPGLTAMSVESGPLMLASPMRGSH